MRDFNSSILIITLITLLTGCSSDNDSTPSTVPEKLVVSGIDCTSAYKSVQTESILKFIADASDKEVRSITIKSSSKFGYDESAYSLSENCFARKGECAGSDQLMYNHGGSPTHFSVDGHFIKLDASSAAKFDQIDFSNLAALQLQTAEGLSITKESIFGTPSETQNLVLGSSSGDFKVGDVLLTLVDDTWSNDNFQLFKFRIDRVSPNNEISFTYQRIAEAPKTDFKNFYCSKQAQIKKASQGVSEGEGIVFGSTYGGHRSSGFGFDYGTNSFHGKFVHSDDIFSFGELRACSEGKQCIIPYVGYVASYWGGVVDVDQTPLESVTRSSWPDLQKIDPQSNLLPLAENRTYLISQLNNQNYTFGAIRIHEIDPAGRWAKFSWKRVAIEKPTRFITYTEVKIPNTDASGRIKLTSSWWTGSHMDVIFAKSINESPHFTEHVYFQASDNTLNIDNRYFPAHSGIVDITASHSSVDKVPKSIANKLKGKFGNSVPIKKNHVYAVVSEQLMFRAVLAVQVVDLVPGKSVRLKYVRLYNGQTFPGEWDR